MYSKNSMYFIDDMDKFSAYVLKVSMHDGMEHFVERGLDELVILLRLNNLVTLLASLRHGNNEPK